MNAILIDAGNAYRLENERLITAPLSRLGIIPEEPDEWYDVDFYSIDPPEVKRCARIRLALLGVED